jgi:hypothetical protein
MRFIAVSAAVFSCLAAVPAQADSGELAAAIADGLTACQEWILEPKTWTEDQQSFANNVGLQDRLVPVGGLPDGVLPSEVLNSATNFWRIDAGKGNGVFVVASSNEPVCNVAGGGPSDFQPEAEALVNRFAESSAWKLANREARADLVTSLFQLRSDSKAELMISRAANTGDRTDRVQFLATVFYQLRK